VVGQRKSSQQNREERSDQVLFKVVASEALAEVPSEA